MFRKSVSIVILVVFGVAAIALADTDAINAKNKEVGAKNLGKPSGPEKKAAGGGIVRMYSKGAIYWSTDSGTHAIYGPAFTKYKSLGAERGRLGYPVTDALAMSGGTQTLFRHGYIFVANDGAVSAEVMPDATFTASTVKFSGGMTAKVTSSGEALVTEKKPQTPIGKQTVNCACSNSQGLQGSCTIIPMGTSGLNCLKGGCNGSCTITVKKEVEGGGQK